AVSIPDGQSVPDLKQAMERLLGHDRQHVSDHDSQPISGRDQEVQGRPSARSTSDPLIVVPCPTGGVDLCGPPAEVANGVAKAPYTAGRRRTPADIPSRAKGSHQDDARSWQWGSGLDPVAFTALDEDLCRRRERYLTRYRYRRCRCRAR